MENAKEFCKHLCLMQITMYKFEIDFSSRIDEESSYYKVAIDCSVTITILPFSYRKC